MSLPPFSPHSHCAKCLSKDIRSEYHAEARGYPSCHVVAEHIHRYCQGCGYEWAETPWSTSQRVDADRVVLEHETKYTTIEDIDGRPRTIRLNGIQGSTLLRTSEERRRDNGM